MNRHGLALGLAGLVVTTMSSCSFILAFEECSVSEHCPNEGDLCIDNTCVAATDALTEVSEPIASDTTWTADNAYRLTDIIYVEPGATLEIEAGTRIFGEQGAALVVQRGGRLIAQGSQLAPIVFTSAQPVGSRARGDWGGVALLGDAPINPDVANLEGLLDESRSGFGGTDPDGSCGVLQYVRIEFAGFAIGTGNELNGLTLGGCGRGTLLDYVQVHLGDDDGVEVFGGTVNLQHMVITRAQDDSLDWDFGWTGAAQFVAIQQDSEGDNGFEASNNEDDHDATPRSAPQLWNVTLIGSTGRPRGMKLKEGTGASINNTIVYGHSNFAIDIEDAATVAQLTTTTGELELHGVMFDEIGAGGDRYFPDLTDEPTGSDEDNDDGFDESEYLLGLIPPTGTLTFNVSPGLETPFNLTSPGWVPQGNAVIDAAVAPPSNLFDGFDPAAAYVGAFSPATIPWTDGWTDYPEN